MYSQADKKPVKRYGGNLSWHFLTYQDGTGWRLLLLHVELVTNRKRSRQLATEAGKMLGIPVDTLIQHCLHCGNCYELCPVKAVERRHCI